MSQIDCTSLPVPDHNQAPCDGLYDPRAKDSQRTCRHFILSSQEADLFFVPIYVSSWSGTVHQEPVRLNLSDASDFSAKIYSYLHAALDQIVKDTGSTHYAQVLAQNIEQGIVESSGLKQSRKLEVETTNIPLSVLLKFSNSDEMGSEKEQGTDFYQRRHIDPLHFHLSDADPFDYVPASQRETASQLMVIHKRFNLALLHLSQALAVTPVDRAFYDQSVQEINEIKEELGLNQQTIQSLADLRDDLEPLQEALTARWIHLYYDAFLLSEPSHKEDVPTQFRWQMTPLFETEAEQSLFETLVESRSYQASDGLSDDEIHKINIKFHDFLENEFAQEFSAIKKDYESNFLGQMATIHFESEPPEERNGFHYTDLDAAPTREFVIDQSEMLLGDTHLGVQRLRQEISESLFAKQDMWRHFQDRFNYIEKEIKTGDSAYLVNPENKFSSHDFIAGLFQKISTAVLLGLREHLPMSALASFLYDEFLSGIYRLPKAQEEYFEKQIARLLEVIMDVLNEKDASGTLFYVVAIESCFDEERVPDERKQFEETLLLLDDCVRQLTHQEVKSSLYSQNTEIQIDRTRGVLNEADRVLQLPDRLEKSLAQWDAYQSFWEVIHNNQSTARVAAPLDRYLTLNMETSELTLELENDLVSDDLPYLAELFSESLYHLYDTIESEVLQFVRPEFAEDFMNHFRFVLCYLKDKFEQSKIQTQRQKIPDDVDLDPEKTDDAWQVLGQLMDVSHMDLKNPDVLLREIEKLTESPNFYYDHKPFFDEKISKLDNNLRTQLLSDLEDTRTQLQGRDFTALTPQEQVAVREIHTSLVEQTALFDSEILRRVRLQIDNPVARRIDSNLREWRGRLDTGWPELNGGSTLFNEDEALEAESFRPDIDFKPDASFYLSEEDFLSLFLPESEGTDEEKILRLTVFLTDYENGYYRYFSPIAFEKDVYGRDIKAVRDHTCYDQLLLVLEDIFHYADRMLNFAEGISQEEQDDYRSVSKIAKSVAYNLQASLAQQPQVPFWVKTKDKKIIGVVPHQTISGFHPDIRFGTEGEEAVFAVQHLVSVAQANPWNYFEDGTFFTQLTDHFGVSLWIQDQKPKQLFDASEFENWTQAECVALRDELVSALPQWDDTARDHFQKIIKVVDEMIQHNVYDCDDATFRILCARISSELNHMVSDPTFYKNNADFFNQRLLDTDSVRAEELRLWIEKIESGEDVLGGQLELMSLMNPALIPQIYNDYPIQSESSELLLTLYEDELGDLPYPRKSSELELILAQANSDEILYLIGRLCEKKLSLKSAELRSDEKRIMRAVSQISISELELIAHALKTNQSVEQDSAFSRFAKHFIQRLSPSQRLWFPAYIKGKIEASKRSRQIIEDPVTHKSRVVQFDDVHFELVRQKDMDLLVQKLNRQESEELLDFLFDHYTVTSSGIPEGYERERWVQNLNPETVSQLTRAVEIYFNDPEIQKKKDRILLAYRRLEKRQQADPFSNEELLYIAVRFSHELEKRGENRSDLDSNDQWLDLENKISRIDPEEFHSQKVGDFFREHSLSTISTVELRMLYGFVYGLVEESYKYNAYQCLRPISPQEGGLLDSYDIQKGGSEPDRFWTWLSHLLDRDFSEGDFEESSLQNLVKEMDEMIAEDTGDDKTGRRTILDPVTSSYIQFTLEGVIEKLETVHDDPKTQRKLEAIRLIHEALFGPYILSNSKEARLHSRYNRHVDFAPPAATLANTYLYNNLMLISKHRNLPNLYDHLSAHPTRMKEVLYSLYLLVTGFDADDEAKEGRIQQSWMDDQDLEYLLLVYEDLNRLTLDYLQKNQDPFLDMTATQAKEALDNLKIRMTMRVDELRAEASLNEFVLLWTYEDKTSLKRNVISLSFKDARDLTGVERQQSDALILDLEYFRAQLASHLLSAKTKKQKEYLNRLIQEIDFALMFATNFEKGFEVSNGPTTYSELWPAVETELDVMGRQSDHLLGLSQIFHGIIFDHEDINQTMDLSRYTIEELHLAWVITQRMFFYARTEFIMTDEEQIQLARLESFLEKENEDIRQQLVKDKQIEKLINGELPWGL